jgi:hypothetical protein
MSIAIYTELDDVKNLDHVDYSTIEFYSWPTKQEFIQSQYKFKIAVIEPDYENLNNLRELCEDLKFCDLVVIQSMELTVGVYHIMKEFDNDNFTFIVNGVCNSSLKNAKVITNIIWMTSTAYYYSTLFKHLMDKRLTPFSKKQFKFDVMYGKPRDHRTFVRNYLTEFDEHPWFYQTPYYVKKDFSDRFYPQNLKFWEDEIVVTNPEKELCTYHDVSIQMCQVMPFKVYNETNYSLICESFFDNRFSFFNEKISKPIIANRLFIVISGQYYLKNLKSLGFKTFDSVIDESYDLEPDNETRWTRALEQAVWLCKQDTDVVLKKITPILLHNSDMINRLESNQLRQEVSTFLITNGYYKK